MSLYTVAPVLQAPEETIIRWSVFAATFADASTSQHLVGVIPRNQHGRVTSAIQAFDPIKMEIITRSGRLYFLSGEPGQDSNADYVWQSWCLSNQVKSVRDVTHEYIKRH
jgi:hypothetical protein